MRVLAVHCVPGQDDPQVEKFFKKLQEELLRLGGELTLLSTVDFPTANRGALRLNFDLSEFENFGIVNEPCFEDEFSKYFDMDLYSSSLRCRGFASFAYELIQKRKIDAIITWQSTHPMSRILGQCGRRFGIPVWSMERGWIPGTIMMDLSENNFYSEACLSVGLQRLKQNYVASKETALRVKHLCFDLKFGRYKCEPIVGRPQLRKKLGLTCDQKVVAFFLHGEPYVWHRPRLSGLLGMSERALLSFVNELDSWCFDRGVALFIQQHPFNRSGRFHLKFDGMKCAREIAINPHSLLALSDASICTTSTITASAIFYPGSIGLLGKSFLSDVGSLPSADEFASVDRFLDHLLNENGDFAVRNKELAINHLCFLYDACLLDIGPEMVQLSAAEVTKLLAKL